MPTDRDGEPWSDATDRGGFSGPGGEPPRRPLVSRRQLAIGAGLAVALGLGLGLWARPELGGADKQAAAERSAPAMPIELDHAPPQPVQANGKLEVLPPDLAAAGRAAGTDSPALAGGEPVTSLAPPPPLPPDEAPARTPAPRTADACAGAAGEAERLVCGDPELAAADQELNRAYRRALRAGVDPRALRADQRDWLGIREEAARHSPRALAQVYEQRIEELNAAAEEDERGSADEGPGL